MGEECKGDELGERGTKDSPYPQCHTRRLAALSPGLPTTLTGPHGTPGRWANKKPHTRKCEALLGDSMNNVNLRHPHLLVVIVVIVNTRALKHEVFDTHDALSPLRSVEVPDPI